MWKSLAVGSSNVFPVINMDVGRSPTGAPCRHLAFSGSGFLGYCSLRVKYTSAACPGELAAVPVRRRSEAFRIPVGLSRMMDPKCS